MTAFTYLTAYVCGISIPFFAMWLTSKFLTPRNGKWFWGVLRFAVFVVTLNMVIYIADPVNILYTLPMFVLGIFYLYTDTWTAKLAVTLVLYSLIMSMNALIDSSRYLHDFYQLLRFTAWLIIFSVGYWRLREERYTLSPHLYKLISALALLPLSATFAVVTLTGYDDNSMRNAAIAFTILPFVLFSSLVLLYAITLLYQHEKIQSENQLYQVRSVYWNSIEQEQLQIRRLRHDISNHFAALSGFLESGNCARALEYVNGLQSITHPHTTPYCAHETINAVLTAKVAAAKAVGIRCTITARIPDALPISDLDLTALFGNAFDNAIEAARDSTDKIITLRTRADKGMLMIRMQNSYNAPRNTKNGQFFTTKPDPHMHGFGLKIMETIIDKYKGSLDVTAQNSVFDIVIAIPLDFPAP